MKKYKIFLITFVVLNLFTLSLNAEELPSIYSFQEKFLLHMEKSFLKEMYEKRLLYQELACDPESTLGHWEKCQGNYYRLDEAGGSYIVNEKRRSTFSYAIVDAQLDAIRQTPIGEVYNDVVSYLKRWAHLGGRKNLLGDIEWTLPGEQSSNDKSKWKLDFSSSLEKMDLSFGYEIAFSSIWQYERFNISFSNIELANHWHTTLAYNIAEDNRILLSAESNELEEKMLFLYNLSF